MERVDWAEQNIDVHPSKVLEKHGFSLLANAGGCLETQRTEVDCLRSFWSFYSVSLNSGSRMMRAYIVTHHFFFFFF